MVDLLPVSAGYVILLFALKFICHGRGIGMGGVVYSSHFHICQRLLPGFLHCMTTGGSVFSRFAVTLQVCLVTELTFRIY